MPDLRQLPAEVLERLGADPIAGVDLITTYRGRTFRLEERRAPVEVRTAEDGSPIIEGYACSTNVEYDVYGGPPYGWTEEIRSGAFKGALKRKDDTRLLVNHDGVPIARSKSGTLGMDEDKVGLHIVTPRGVDPENPTVRELISSMERGDIDEMSFAFTVDVDDEGNRMEKWNKDYSKRIITGVVLYDVAVVTYPANPATHVIVKSDETTTETRGMPLELALALAASL